MPQNIDVTRRNRFFDPLQQATEDAAKSGQMPTLQMAVVIEVFTDIEINSDFADYIKSRVSNPYFVDVAPPNAVLAKVISNSAGNASTSLVVLFPFFSSHLQLPVYPGEVVLAMFKNGGTSGDSGLGYWIDVVRGAKPSDDPNYVHYDRLMDPTNLVDSYSTTDLSEVNQRIKFSDLVFNNGAEHNGVFTLDPGNTGKNPYNIIVANAYTNKFTSIEPVPRWNKRPNEFIIQGKNNSLIVLGEDRRGQLRGAFEAGQSNTTDLRGGAASIDLVVGRGRTPTTAPRIAINERSGYETNKVPFKYKKDVNQNEGDPDLQNDAARLQVLQQSKVDTNYGLTEQRIPQDVYPFIQPEAKSGVALQVDNNDKQLNAYPTNNSYVVGKADHIRFIARQSSIEGAAADGTILLVHEGSADSTEDLQVGGKQQGSQQTQGKGLSFLTLNEEGAHLHGKYVHLGPARNHKEPAILWSNYTKTISNLQDQITSLHQTYSGQVMSLNSTILMLCQTLGAVLNSANVCPVNGPNPALTAASAIFIQVAEQLNQSNPMGGIADQTTDLMQKQRDTLDNAKAENQSQIVFIS